MTTHRVGLLALVAGVSFAQSGLADEAKRVTPPAATKPAEPDDELLEFLGSVGADDDEWIDYLSQTDIVKVAKEGKDQKPRATDVKVKQDD